MAEERTRRGRDAANDRETTAPSGWVTTQQAARALGISPRTVRWHIERGHLEATPEGEGVRRSWLVSIDSLQAFRDTRQTTDEQPGDYRAAVEDAAMTASGPGNPIRELADRLVEEAARASEFRVRLEISERAQSTLEENLAAERRRREEAERERDELRRRLEVSSEPPGAPETPVESPEGEEVWRDAEGSQRAPERPPERPHWREEAQDTLREVQGMLREARGAWRRFLNR